MIHQTRKITHITEDIAIRWNMPRSVLDFMNRNNLFPIEIDKLKKTNIEQLKTICYPIQQTDPLFETNGVLHSEFDELHFDNLGRLIKHQIKKSNVLIYHYKENELEWFLEEKFIIIQNFKAIKNRTRYKKIIGSKLEMITTQCSTKSTYKDVFDIKHNGTTTRRLQFKDANSYTIFDEYGNSITYKDKYYGIIDKSFVVYNDFGQIVERYRNIGNSLVLTEKNTYDNRGNLIIRNYPNFGYTEFSYTFDSNDALESITVSDSRRILSSNNGISLQNFNNGR